MRRVFPSFLLVAFFLSGNSVFAAGPSPYKEGRHDKGELKHVNGVPVLRLAGTPEEIGEQIAVLTGVQVKRLLAFPRELAQKEGLGALWPVLLNMGKSMEPSFPADHLRELEAGVKKLGVERDLAIFGNTFPDVSKVAGCSSLIVGGDRSTTGGPLFGRNLDYPTLGFLHQYSLVSVYHPKGKKSFISIGFPGMLGCLSGINEDGLALAVHEVRRTKDESVPFDPKGVPYTLCFRRILEECSTVAEAEKLLRATRRSTMLNLGVCDRRGGSILEFTTKNVIVRGPEKGITTCTNHFCSTELGVGQKCARLNHLDTIRASQGKMGLKEVSHHLHLANQGAATLQTMIFEPAAMKLHLGIGECPSSKLPMTELDLKALLTKPE